MDEAPNEEETLHQSGETQPLLQKEKGGMESQFSNPEQPRQQEQDQSGGADRNIKGLIFSVKGFIRVLQIALALAVVCLLRANGGSLWVVMSSIDEVYLAIGVSVGFLVITPAMYISYLSSGGSTSAAPLEMIVSAVGFVLYFVNGILIINTWKDADSASNDQSSLTDVQSLVTAITGATLAGATQQIVQEVLAAGALSLINGVLYAIELIYSYREHKKVSSYQNPA